MSKKKSPLDDLFNELYGFYPNRAGQAYEMLVAAAFKIVTGQQLKYDQHLRGEYSETDYQIDGLNLDEQKAIEAKDYTIDNRKVGRPDLQKLQGALSDLTLRVDNSLLRQTTQSPLRNTLTALTKTQIKSKLNFIK